MIGLNIQRIPVLLVDTKKCGREVFLGVLACVFQASTPIDDIWTARLRYCFAKLPCVESNKEGRQGNIPSLPVVVFSRFFPSTQLKTGQLS